MNLVVFEVNLYFISHNISYLKNRIIELELEENLEVLW